MMNKYKNGEFAHLNFSMIKMIIVSIPEESNTKTCR